MGCMQGMSREGCLKQSVTFEYEHTSDAVVQRHHNATKRGAYGRARQRLHGGTGVLSQAEQLLCRNAGARENVVLQTEWSV